MQMNLHWQYEAAKSKSRKAGRKPAVAISSHNGTMLAVDGLSVELLAKSGRSSPNSGLRVTSRSGKTEGDVSPSTPLFISQLPTGEALTNQTNENTLNPSSQLIVSSYQESPSVSLVMSDPTDSFRHGEQKRASTTLKSAASDAVGSLLSKRSDPLPCERSKYLPGTEMEQKPVPSIALCQLPHSSESDRSGGGVPVSSPTSKSQYQLSTLLPTAQSSIGRPLQPSRSEGSSTVRNYCEDSVPLYACEHAALPRSTQFVGPPEPPKFTPQQMKSSNSSASVLPSNKQPAPCLFSREPSGASQYSFTQQEVNLPPVAPPIPPHGPRRSNTSSGGRSNGKYARSKDGRQLLPTRQSQQDVASSVQYVTPSKDSYRVRSSEADDSLRQQSYNRSAAPTRPGSGQKTSHLHHLLPPSDPPLAAQSGLQKNNANSSALVPVSLPSASVGNRLLVMPSSSSARLLKERKQQEYPLKQSNHLSSGGSVQQQPSTPAYLNSYLQSQPCCNHAQPPPLSQVVPGHFRGTEAAPHNIISSQESPDGTFEISV